MPPDIGWSGNTCQGETMRRIHWRSFWSSGSACASITTSFWLTYLKCFGPCFGPMSDPHNTFQHLDEGGATLVTARLIMEIIQAENIGLGVHFRALQSSPILPQPLRLSARAMSGGRGGIGSPRLASLASRVDG